MVSKKRNAISSAASCRPWSNSSMISDDTGCLRLLFPDDAVLYSPTLLMPGARLCDYEYVHQ